MDSVRDAQVLWLGREFVGQLADPFRVLRRREVLRLSDYHWIDTAITWDIVLQSRIVALSVVAKVATIKSQTFTGREGFAIALPPPDECKAAAYAALRCVICALPHAQDELAAFERLARVVAFEEPTAAGLAVRDFEACRGPAEASRLKPAVTRREAEALASSIVMRVLGETSTGEPPDVAEPVLRSGAAESFRTMCRLFADGMVLWTPASGSAIGTESVCWSFREALYAADLPWVTRWLPETRPRLQLETDCRFGRTRAVLRRRPRLLL
jgi:hypothetical protein